VEGKTEQCVKLDQNEAALSIALCKFSNQPESQQFVVVGVAKDYQVESSAGGWRILVHLQVSFLTKSYTFYHMRLNADCTNMELVHKTSLDEVPTAICSFQGRLLVGVGRMLRLYDMGKKKMLRKCENKVKNPLNKNQ
ncbi:unnamed protein product, partial [Timema podura]|nr:unnamed protein product [Timema podura]